MSQVTKVISGGQTGVDQAALRAAIALGITIGGWCPPGRVCEDGIIPEEFLLKETPFERSEDAPEIPRSMHRMECERFRWYPNTYNLYLGLRCGNNLGKTMFNSVREAIFG